MYQLCGNPGQNQAPSPSGAACGGGIEAFEVGGDALENDAQE
jgi:hypothetical protein